MLKDIEFRKVDNFVIAIVPRDEAPVDPSPDVIDLWDCYIINLYPKPLKNVLVSSVGYGKIEDKERKTTNLRHFLEEMGSQKAYLLEPIPTNLFKLSNQFWVSFTYDDHLYDKKYVFVQGSINKDFFTNIPVINKVGVMIQ